MTSMGVDACISQVMKADGVASAEVKREMCTYSLLTICKAMRELLCEVDKVQPAMRLLASTAVDRNDLGTTDVRLLFTFFSEKLSQAENQTTALECLALLVANLRDRFECNEEWFKIVAFPFLKHVRVQQLPLNCRKQCFCVMTFLFTDKTLPTCSSDALGALLELLDGESDPELVLQTFDLHVIVATRAAREAFAPVLDDYFESISSYFPVVFSQPPGCKVTKVDLRTHLKRCLCLAVYSECCVPFMLGKLASPSIAVKEDVADALLTCFDTYRHGAMAPFYASLVTHMKNEVVKLSSFSDRASSPTLTKCIFMCCEILGRISKLCGVKTQAEALEVFGPVLEGFLSALVSDTSISSAYATMVFHVLTGSWNCCLFLSSYLFSMLSMSLTDAERPANVYILFAALVAGMLDGLAAFPGDDHAKSMRDGIERSTPPVAAGVRQSASAWGLPPSSTPFPSPPRADGVDNFAVVCGCEFVVSVLKLSLRLRPWLAADVVRDGIDALLRAALLNSPEASSKIRALLRDYTAEDGEGVRDALVRLLSTPDVPADEGLAVVCEVASSSTDALLLAYERGFFSTECAWMVAMPPEKTARAFQTALDHFGDTLQASEAERMAAVLSRNDVPPEYFPCACFVARNLSGALCARLMAGETAVSQLGVAALLASCDRKPDVGYHWPVAVEGLVALTASDMKAWRRVGMEGITGAVLHRVADNARATAAATLPTDARLLSAVAVLWGDLLALDSNGDSGTSRHIELVSSFAQEYMPNDDATAIGRASSDSVVEAFTYLPFSAQHRASRPSLLHLMLRACTSSSLQSGTTFCIALRCLVESETETQVRGCLAELLEVLSELTRSNGTGGGALARALLLSVHAKCGSDAAFTRFVLLSERTMAVLLGGVGADIALSTRQSSLQLLTSLARGAVAMASDCAPEEKANWTSVRDRVLGAVKRALGDHKRKVRRAAGACSHEWHKLH
jgi:DNA repair/transcription protein MET18/MMS19